MGSKLKLAFFVKEIFQFEYVLGADCGLNELFYKGHILLIFKEFSHDRLCPGLF